MEKNKILL